MPCLQSGLADRSIGPGHGGGHGLHEVVPAVGVLQGLSHGQGHHQLLRELLLAESHGSGGDHHAFPPRVLKFGHLLNDGRQPAEGQAFSILAGDDRAPHLDDHPFRVLQLSTIQKGRSSRIGVRVGQIGDMVREVADVDSLAEKPLLVRGRIRRGRPSEEPVLQEE